MSTPTPGWYPDPEQPGTLRYWDGSAWTDQRAPMQQQQAPTSTWTVARGVALGVGAVLAALFVIGSCAYSEAQSERRDCILNAIEGGYSSAFC